MGVNSPLHYGKAVPKKGPRQVKVFHRERRLIRSMVGVDSKNVSVQAELDPNMTLRSLVESQAMDLTETVVSSVPFRLEGCVALKTSRPLPIERDLNKEFASLYIKPDHTILESVDC